MKPEFIVNIPATSANLGPGFDCMGIALDLYNQFRVTTESAFEISVEGIAAGDVSLGHDNLLIQAANLLLRHVSSNLSTTDWCIYMDTSIPSASGLGSSASAIAAGMLLANEVVGYYEPSRQLTRHQVVELATAMEGHPDNVTPALLGGAWLSIYHDATLKSYELALPSNLTFVVATPQVQVSTDESRRALTQMVARGDAVYNVGQAARLMIALERNDLKLLSEDFGDRLHEPFRTNAIPQYNAVVESASTAGAATVTLSGSGPTLLAWCDGLTSASAVQRSIQSVWAQSGVGCSVTIHSPFRYEPRVTFMETREAKL